MSTKQIISNYQSSVARWCKEYGIEQSLILAQIQKESSGNMFAKGNAGDIGLLQVTQGALDDFNRMNKTKFSLVDVAINADLQVRVGIWYLRSMFDLTQDWFQALRSYNAGYQGAKDNPTISVDYATEIMNIKAQIESNCYVPI